MKGPSEATLDSHFLLMASNMGAQKARAMKSGMGSFDVDDFITKLRNFMNGGLKPESIPAGEDEDGLEYNIETSKLDWDRIGRLALARSRRAPALTFMSVLGSLVDKNADRISGLDLSLLNKSTGMLPNEQGNKRTIVPLKNLLNSRKMIYNSHPMKPPRTFLWYCTLLIFAFHNKRLLLKQLQSILDQIGRVNLFRFVINPNDFAQSVENIFYLSFLIRDGKVAWEIEDAEPFICRSNQSTKNSIGLTNFLDTCVPPNDEDYANGLRKQQLVIEFDEEIWRVRPAACNAPFFSTYLYPIHLGGD